MRWLLALEGRGTYNWEMLIKKRIQQRQIRLSTVGVGKNMFHVIHGFLLAHKFPVSPRRFVGFTEKNLQNCNYTAFIQQRL